MKIFFSLGKSLQGSVQIFWPHGITIKRKSCLENNITDMKKHSLFISVFWHSKNWKDEVLNNIPIQWTTHFNKSFSTSTGCFFFSSVFPLIFQRPNIKKSLWITRNQPNANTLVKGKTVTLRMKNLKVILG